MILQVAIPAEALPSAGPPRPEFLRIPKNGSPCQFTGLSRSGFYRMIAAGKVKPVKLGSGQSAQVLIRFSEMVDAINSSAVPAAAVPVP